MRPSGITDGIAAGSGAHAANPVHASMRPSGITDGIWKYQTDPMLADFKLQ